MMMSQHLNAVVAPAYRIWLDTPGIEDALHLPR